MQYYEKLEKNHSNYGHGMSYDRTKYNEDFEIISLGGRGGTLTNDTFTIKCYPVSDPDCIFKAEI